MKTIKLPVNDIEIDINNDGVITRVGTIDFIEHYLEMKLSDYRLKDIQEEYGIFPYYLDNLIYEIGTQLPETNEQFEKIIRENWGNWNTEEVLIGNQLDHYQIGDKGFAHDMIEYYGKRSDFGDLFQRRYDFVIPDIEIRIKSEQYV